MSYTLLLNVLHFTAKCLTIAASTSCLTIISTPSHAAGTHAMPHSITSLAPTGMPLMPYSRHSPFPITSFTPLRAHTRTTAKANLVVTSKRADTPVEENTIVSSRSE